jgi:UV DNA damage repair endonuclease
MQTHMRFWLYLILFGDKKFIRNISKIPRPLLSRLLLTNENTGYHYFDQQELRKLVQMRTRK